MTNLTPAEKALVERWIIENVDAKVVPADEDNDEALVYNLVMLVRGSWRTYCYAPDQDKEIESWGYGK